MLCSLVWMAWLITVRAFCRPPVPLAGQGVLRYRFFSAGSTLSGHEKPQAPHGIALSPSKQRLL